ncbi:MAG TPA: hypothetical protein VG322_12190 [Candidatus Acidoferrales bacterium]|jgi:hypothetical protein|nr:hypothetical protein [Candidatus Acidoferrales bacterium]
MKRYNFLKIAPIFGLGLALSLSSPVVAQQSQANMPGYPTADEPQSAAPSGNPSNNSGKPPNNTDSRVSHAAPSGPGVASPAGPQQGAPLQNSMSSPQAVPPVLVLPVGTMIQVRTDQWLSTDRNLVGDGFNATLAQPIVVDGWVVARRGQAILGRVSLSQKANGSNHNTSQLGLQLSELTFADGQLLPIQTQLSQSGTGPDRGQQAGTVATTTGVGAIIGAIVGRGPGAAIGAGIGAIAGLGIITNTGRPTVIPPETILTFRLNEAVTMSTVKSPFAFRQIGSVDYSGAMNSNRPQLNRRDSNAYPPPPPPPYYGYPYSPYYPGWGYYPPVSLGFGYGWGWGPGYYGRRGRFR